MLIDKLNCVEDSRRSLMRPAILALPRLHSVVTGQFTSLKSPSEDMVGSDLTDFARSIQANSDMSQTVGMRKKSIFRRTFRSSSGDQVTAPLVVLSTWTMESWPTRGLVSSSWEPDSDFSEFPMMVNSTPHWHMCGVVPRLRRRCGCLSCST